MAAASRACFSLKQDILYAILLRLPDLRLKSGVVVVHTGNLAASIEPRAPITGAGLLSMNCTACIVSTHNTAVLLRQNLLQDPSTMSSASPLGRTVDAVALSTITNMINPRVLQTLASGTLLYGRVIARDNDIMQHADIADCRYSGSCLWGSFVSGVVAYKTLPRQVHRVCLHSMSSS